MKWNIRKILHEVKIINSLVADPFITYSPAFTCSKSTMETPEQCAKSARSTLTIKRPKRKPFRVRLQISLLKLTKIEEINWPLLPWSHKKTYNFLMISGGIEIIEFAHICLTLEATLRYYTSLLSQKNSVSRHDVSILNFALILHIFLVFTLLTWNR